MLQQKRVHARARLVPRPQLIAERLDDVVGRHADVAGAALDHAEHGAHDPPGCGHLTPAAVDVRRQGEEVAKQLVGAVYEIDVHPSTTRWAPTPAAYPDTSAGTPTRT